MRTCINCQNEQLVWHHRGWIGNPSGRICWDCGSRRSYEWNCAKERALTAARALHRLKMPSSEDSNKFGALATEFDAAMSALIALEDSWAEVSPFAATSEAPHP